MMQVDIEGLNAPGARIEAGPDNLNADRHSDCDDEKSVQGTGASGRPIPARTPEGSPNSGMTSVQ